MHWSYLFFQRQCEVKNRDVNKKPKEKKESRELTKIHTYLRECWVRGVSPGVWNLL